MEIEQLQMTPVKMAGQPFTDKVDDNTLKPEKTFGSFLVDALRKTNDLQKNAAKMDIALAAGKVDDISKVVVASEKAQIALNLTMSIRNKAIDAYKEIMRMQV
ncbi:flagellar hook-basal body complex protein FliE [Pectinatus sottacetonis]|uniref:flagellar hook-basal body complex protein FliE n=1 Tax=Pectinatus sottacetonis TaxID=1002795 RepID=UPI0018C4ABD1|nr:flagellar hook-basal body complex protein FliE [Pectinatus sottacetonis]